MKNNWIILSHRKITKNKKDNLFINYNINFNKSITYSHKRSNQILNHFNHKFIHLKLKKLFLKILIFIIRWLNQMKLIIY